jgi:hypothetical protein
MALVGCEMEQASGLAVVLRHALAHVVAHFEAVRALGSARSVPTPHALLRCVCGQGSSLGPGEPSLGPDKDSSCRLTVREVLLIRALRHIIQGQ